VIPAGNSPRAWNTLAQKDWSGTGDVRTRRVVRRSLQAVLSCIGPYLPSNCCSNAKQGFGAQAAPIPAEDYSGVLKKLPQMGSGLYGGCPCHSCGSDGALWVFALTVCIVLCMMMLTVYCPYGHICPLNRRSHKTQGSSVLGAAIPAGEYHRVLKTLAQMDSGWYWECTYPCCGPDGDLWVSVFTAGCVVLHRAISAL